MARQLTIGCTDCRILTVIIANLRKVQQCSGGFKVTKVPSCHDQGWVLLQGGWLQDGYVDKFQINKKMAYVHDFKNVVHLCTISYLVHLRSHHVYK